MQAKLVAFEKRTQQEVQGLEGQLRAAQSDLHILEARSAEEIAHLRHDNTRLEAETASQTQRANQEESRANQEKSRANQEESRAISGDREVRELSARALTLTASLDQLQMKLQKLEVANKGAQVESDNHAASLESQVLLS